MNVPRRAFDLDDLDGDISLLSTPSIAYVCQEARQALFHRERTRDLFGSGFHFSGSSRTLPFPEGGIPLMRSQEMGRTRWVSFIPHKDVLLFYARRFCSVHREVSGIWSPTEKDFLKEAEHIVVHDASIPERYWRGDNDRISKRKLHKMLRGLCEWTLHVGSHAFFSARNQRYGISSPADDPARPVDELAISANDPVSNLRIFDIAMNGVTEIDKTHPPGLIQRLFGSDLIRIVDLRCEWEYRALLQMMREEFPANIRVPDTRCFQDLEYSMKILKDVEDEIFVPARHQVLIEIARYRHSLSVMDLPPQGPPPFKDNELDFDGELDFEADWARELIARLDIRPVHVYKRVGGA